MPWSFIVGFRILGLLNSDLPTLAVLWTQRLQRGRLVKGLEPIKGQNHGPRSLSTIFMQNKVYELNYPRL